MSSWQGYAAEAEALLRQYEALDFATVHAAVRHLLPEAPARVLDVGAGTGRDAAALAAVGHAVVAVEPVGILRHHAARLHPSPRIAWLEDSLPDLGRVEGRFGLVMLTAVWMHLDAAERQRGMTRLAALLEPGAPLVLSLRHGPVPPGRRMFEVPAEETIAQAEAAGLRTVLRIDRAPGTQAQPDVRWTRLGFRAPA